MWPASILILFLVFVAPTRAHSDGLFFTYTTAQRLYTDMGTCRQGIALCDESESLLMIKVSGLALDKEAYRKEAEDYKAAYLKSDEARLKSETDKPSRLTWFTTGVLATLVSILGTTLSH